MRNFTLVERIDSDNSITLKYSFGDIIIKYRYRNDAEPSLSFKDVWFNDIHLLEYDKAKLMSGIEEMALEAIQNYYRLASTHAEFFKI